MTPPVSSSSWRPLSQAQQVRVMVVDDEPTVLRSLSKALRLAGYEVLLHDSAESALELLDEVADEVDAVLLDIHMPGMDGLEMLGRVRKSWPAVPVLLMTGAGTVDSAIAALRSGAYDYLLKPFDMDRELVPAVRRASDHHRLLLRNQHLERRLDLAQQFPELVGKTTAMREVFTLVKSFGPTDSTVLLLGESGTGKELVARALHAQSARSAAPFVAINCGGLSEPLLESELFGHVRGAFTGAVTARRGLFEHATGGTLFLDEIADLSLGIQANFLRVLEQGMVRPLGANEYRPVDVRIVSATNRDLHAMVKQGTFRDDLYYRINLMSIRLPSVRERREDIPLLVHHFINLHGPRMGISVTGVEPAALGALTAYDWPGNVRELENVVERALVLSQQGPIGLAALPPGIGAPGPPSSRDPAAPPVATGTFAESRAAFERAYLEHVLGEAEGNIAEAARLAGMDRSNFRRLLKRAAIEAPKTRSARGRARR